ncbi:hypothetical protein ABZ490_12590 [Streptomyces sp. NPDC005811]|uniref:hypothetical protein n=1 Tax=Streptomyces sp. NPDC005811 TaxID=3154565 RepID=UPI0033FB2097
MTEEKETEGEYGVGAGVGTDVSVGVEAESVEETRAAVLAAWRADRLPGQWLVSADQMAWSC